MATAGRSIIRYRNAARRLMGVSKGFFEPGGESLDDVARSHFRDEYTAELARARAKGYTEEHDHEHGPQHLLDWATEYIYRGEPIKAAALVAAVRALLACTVSEHGHAPEVLTIPDMTPEERLLQAIFGEAPDRLQEAEERGYRDAFAIPPEDREGLADDEIGTPIEEAYWRGHRTANAAAGRLLDALGDEETSPNAGEPDHG